MNHYVLCTQQPWGEQVFAKVCAGATTWQLRERREQWTLCKTRQQLNRLTVSAVPRYIFFVHWSDIVPDRILALGECVNFHCTPLPYGRGGHPIENMIMRGHEETTLTAHRMTSEVDAGSIYAKHAPVSLAGTKVDVLARLVAPCARLIRHIVATQPIATPQVGKVVQFTRLSPSAYEAFWKQRARP